MLIENRRNHEKWVHQTPSENGKIITFLQNIYLIQSASHHSSHHKSPFDMQYCILTNWVNPVLGYIGFWKGVIGFFNDLVFTLLPEAQFERMYNFNPRNTRYFVWN